MFLAVRPGLNPADQAAAEAAMGVVCAFRPISRPEQVDSFRRAASEATGCSWSHSPSQGQSSPQVQVQQQQQYSPAPSQRCPATQPSSVLGDFHRRHEAASTESAASSMAPRGRCPLPTQAPASPSPAAYADVFRHSAAGRPRDATSPVTGAPAGRTAQHDSPMRASEPYGYLTGALSASREMLQKQQEMELRMYDTQQLVLALQRELEDSRNYIAQLEHRLNVMGGAAAADAGRVPAGSYASNTVQPSAVYSSAQLSVNREASFATASDAANTTQDGVLSPTLSPVERATATERYDLPRECVSTDQARETDNQSGWDEYEAQYEEEGSYSEYEDSSVGEFGSAQPLQASTSSLPRWSPQAEAKSETHADAKPSQAASPLHTHSVSTHGGVKVHSVKGSTATARFALGLDAAAAHGIPEQRSIASAASEGITAQRGHTAEQRGTVPVGSAAHGCVGDGARVSSSSRWADTTYVESEVRISANSVLTTISR
jgi:hypothetical protein